MKLLLASAILACLTASGAFGQAGVIGVFRDPAGVDCSLSIPPGLIPYYVVHILTPGATGCQYWAPKPSCFNATWLSDTNMFPVTLGTSQTGVVVGYGTCRASPILIQTINYIASGVTPDCCCYYVYGNPSADPPGLLMVDCADHLLEAGDATSIINSKPFCFCGDPPFACVNDRIPVTETTWGRLKSVYSE